MPAKRGKPNITVGRGYSGKFLDTVDLPGTKAPQKREQYVKLVVLVVLVVILALLLGAHRYLMFVAPKQVAMIQPKDAAHIYVPAGNEKLAPRKVEIDMATPDRERAEIILRALKEEHSIPGGVSLLDIASDTDGTVYLNLSHALMGASPKGPAEITMVYAIVNSFLATFRNMRKVQILVEGKPLHTLGGVVYTYLPLEFNNDLVED